MCGQGAKLHLVLAAASTGASVLPVDTCWLFGVVLLSGPADSTLLLPCTSSCRDTNTRWILWLLVVEVQGKRYYMHIYFAVNVHRVFFPFNLVAPSYMRGFGKM